MLPNHFDALDPAFVTRIRVRHALKFRDECAQIHHEAEDAYCKLSAAPVSAENDARYEYAKRAMQVSRGLLAEANDIYNSFN